MQRKTTILFALLGMASCSAGNAEPVESTSGESTAESPQAGPGSTAWRGTSTSGRTVTLSGLADPIEAGPLRIEITLEEGGSNRAPTVDLISPSMPMHGVVRYRSESLGGSRYTVDAEIPMEGSWLLYVNLDEGADAAEFGFEVLPSSTGLGHQHGATGEPEDNTPVAHAGHGS